MLVSKQTQATLQMKGQAVTKKRFIKINLEIYVRAIHKDLFYKKPKKFERGNIRVKKALAMDEIHGQTLQI